MNFMPSKLPQDLSLVFLRSTVSWQSCSGSERSKLVVVYNLYNIVSTYKPHHSKWQLILEECVIKKKIQAIKVDT